jgi:hypothetical protein
MPISKTALVLLSLLLVATCMLAQTPGSSTISSPQPSPSPITGPAVATRPAEKPAPNVNLHVPPPQRPRVRRVAMIEIPGRPGFKGVAMVKDFLVMAHPAADTVDVFNLRKRRLVTRVNDMKGASGIAVDEAGGLLFVANSDANQIAVISTEDWKLERTIALKASPDELLFVPQLHALYASNWRDQSISAIDLRQDSTVHTAAVEGRPKYLVFDPANQQIFATLEDAREVIVLDTRLKVVKRYPLVASQPTGLVLDAKSRRLYVAVRYAVLALDADTGQELRRVAAPAGIDMLWLDQAGNNLYGGSSDGTIAAMRTTGASLSADSEFKTDVHGHTFAFDAAKKLIYFPGGSEGRSKLLILRQIEPNAGASPELATK